VASSQYWPDDYDPHGRERWESDGESDRETTRPLPVVEDDNDSRDGGSPAGRPRHRGLRVLYRVTVTIATLIACLFIGFAVLMVRTPSAGQATAIAARIARQHHEGYPGPAVPANFARPLIATEDHRFYSDAGGIDPLALGHAALSAATGGPDQGATIEVQLAKMLYIGANSAGNSSISGKLTEAALAVKLDAMYSKQQILQMYAEVAYYGHGYYGLQQASCGYFGHPPAALTLTQGAMLAGVVNAPAVDDPVSDPAQARVRLEHVIGRMVAVGYLTPAQGQAALNAPLHLTPGHSPSC
jgi:penicillin-binding protein 1A